ncbi:hypothetical protein SEPCBS57363_001070 [Sporothrix epigloea]|uniref:Uncharacterized protein n=1 Tax=Sporothrix epigloea TaxID=1892477 RepID=A0ABP0D8A1_9PEZI
MAGHSPSPAANSGAFNQSARPIEPTGFASLPPKPVFGNSNVITDSTVSDAAAAANRSESPPVNCFPGHAETQDFDDFPKPATPVSEVNGYISEINNADSHEPVATGAAGAVAASLPTAPAAPTEAPKEVEPAAITGSLNLSADPAQSFNLARITTASATHSKSSSKTGLRTTPADLATPTLLTAVNTLAGEKRKADATADALAENATEPDKPYLSALFGNGASSRSAEPPTAEPEPEIGLESPPKKLKVDTGTKTDLAAADSAQTALPAPLSTPAAPPVSITAPSPVTVSTPVPTATASVSSLEVNLGPAPSADDIAATSNEAPAISIKKRNTRAKREKKPQSQVGKTARKTRSQGPA